MFSLPNSSRWLRCSHTLLHRSIIRGHCVVSRNIPLKIPSSYAFQLQNVNSLHSSSKLYVNITFIEESSGNVIKLDVEEGKSILDIALDKNIDIEGACGGEMACSTCHVILPQKFYDKLSPRSEEEEDMLDLAWGVTDTSRLGCQIKITKDLEGIEILVPKETNSML